MRAAAPAGSGGGGGNGARKRPRDDSVVAPTSQGSLKRVNDDAAAVAAAPIHDASGEAVEQHGGARNGSSASQPFVISSSSDDDSEGEDEEDEEDRHHPGHLMVDHDNWEDHDERCHGVIDSNALRREYPENYVWDCCDQAGDAPGCTPGAGPGVDELYATSPEPSVEEPGGSEPYHEGELEVDWDYWADHDEDCHGTIDTKTNRREHPDGFRWNCCDEVGTYARGCCDPSSEVSP